MDNPRRILRASLLSAVVFACISSASESSFALLDSLSGKAEVQRAGQQRWLPAKQGIKLYDNDVLRVMENSNARLIWSDGSVMYVHPNSQVLMNLYTGTANNLVTRHATVFFGAVFFVIKEILPRGIATRYDTKVYTPTAILSIRGTSFEVRVEQASGATEIGVLNGTVLVGNILKQQSIFLAAGYATRVGMNADPIQPKPMVQKDIESLKTWVPTAVIDAEMKQQTAQSKKDLYTITGKLEDKVLVFPFENLSSYEGGWDVGGVVASFMADKIGQNIPGVSVVKSQTKTVDVIKAGEAQTSRYVLSGEIRMFDIIQRASISADAGEYTEFCIAKVRIFLQLVDVQSRRLVFAKEVAGEVSGKNTPENTWKEIARQTFSMNDPAFSGTILAKAIVSAVDQTTADISRYLHP